MICDLKNLIKTKIQADECINLIRPYIQDTECYLVGGSIRDIFAGESSHDRDLTVKSAEAEKLAKLIADKEHAHFITLDEQNKIYRVVLADKVNYFDISAMLDDNFETDINRRDLTINSIAYDINKNEIIDLNNGIGDFENKIIRTCNLQNFSDDFLRMLRVYRFAAKYDFEIDKNITDFIKNNAEFIEKPAKERVYTELIKLFESRYTASALKKMNEAGLLSHIFPVTEELKQIPPNTHHHLNLFEHSVETVRQIQKNYENLPENIKANLQSTELGSYKRIAFLKLAGFFHDIGKPDCWTIEEDTGRHRFIMHDDIGSKKVVPILQNLKFSKKQISYIQQMIKFHIYPSSLVWQEEVGSKARLKFYRKMYPYCYDIIVLAQSDRLSAMGKAVTVDMIVRNITDLSVLMNECSELSSAEAKPKPFLSGEDVMQLTGLPQSKELGFYVKSVYSAQLDGNISSKDEAVDYIKNLMMKLKNK